VVALLSDGDSQSSLIRANRIRPGANQNLAITVGPSRVRQVLSTTINHWKSTIVSRSSIRRDDNCS